MLIVKIENIHMYLSFVCRVNILAKTFENSSRSYTVYCALLHVRMREQYVFCWHCHIIGRC